MEAIDRGPPRSVGRYELLFRIASGGMAEVYAARVRGEAGFEKLVAVKRMLPQLADDDEFVSMFLDEARVAANIDSPNCVSTLDLGRAEDGSLYIVMELVVGVTLAKLLRWSSKSRKPVPISVAVELVAQAGKGLHDAHVAKTPLGEPLKIVHRDVSPQNVLVGVDGRVRLTDFGVARAMHRMTQTVAGRIKGKFAYSAPEQLTGAELDRRADVFALGVVAWEFFVGQRLFVGEHPMETMERVRSMPIPDVCQVRPDVPQGISDVVLAALSRDLESRTGSAREFVDALREAARDAGIPTATREDVGQFVESAGGEALAKMKGNIRLALERPGGAISGTASSPSFNQPEFNLTPSGVQSAVQPISQRSDVASDIPDPTDPDTGIVIDTLSIDADASAPFLASPGSVITQDGQPFALPPPVRRSPWLLLGVLGVVGLLAGGLVVFLLAGPTELEEGEMVEISATPAEPTSTEDLGAAANEPEGELEAGPGSEPESNSVGMEESSEGQEAEANAVATPPVRPRVPRPRPRPDPGSIAEVPMQTVMVTQMASPMVSPMNVTMMTEPTPASMTSSTGTAGIDLFDRGRMR